VKAAKRLESPGAELALHNGPHVGHSTWLNLQQNLRERSPKEAGKTVTQRGRPTQRPPAGDWRVRLADGHPEADLIDATAGMVQNKYVEGEK
jgi:hypothetical protein